MHILKQLQHAKEIGQKFVAYNCNGEGLSSVSFGVTEDEAGENYIAEHSYTRNMCVNEIAEEIQAYEEMIRERLREE